MKIHYNVTGEERKELVGVIGRTVGITPVYKFMPTCAYAINNITVEKDGSMVWDERTDEDTIRKVSAALAAAGFEGTGETADTEADSGATGLTVSLPLDGFSRDSLDRLQKLVDSKAGLIRKALGADRLTVQASEGTVRFPWWDTLPAPEETAAYTAFISALCKMAKEAKRVTATEKDVDSEKYAFRGFLLRLGFIGAESKPQRKILMKNLSGSAAFPNKEKADAFSAAQKAKRDARREVTA